MLTVTETAKEKLKEALQQRKTRPELTFRLIASSSIPKRLEITLDKEKEGDEVVENEEGVKLLLIGSDVIPELEGLVFDYKMTPQGAGFTISMLSSGT